MDAGFAGLMLDAGIVFAAVDGHPLRLNVVRPAVRDSAPVPAVIWVHGGGWVEGDYNNGTAWWCCPLIARAGFVALSVEYRLSPEAVFPAQIHDVKSAIRWTRAHAAALGVDPNRIGIWGHSAGGHLAALAGVSGDLPELEGTAGLTGYSSAVQAVVAGSPPTDFLADDDGQESNEEVMGYVIGLFGGIEPEKRELMRLASPVAHVTRNAPPMLIVHGDADDVVPVSQADELVAALRDAGVHVEYERLPGADHVLFAGERRYLPEHGLKRFGELARAFFQTWLMSHRAPR